MRARWKASRSPVSSGEDDAQAELRDAVAMLGAPPIVEPDLLGYCSRIVETCDAAGAALVAVRQANSFPAGLEAGIAAALALDVAGAALTAGVNYLSAVRQQVAALTRGTRAAVGGIMVSTGCPGVRTAWHDAHPVEPAPHVEIDAPALLPARFWRARDPEPDRAALLTALRSGPVPGARLAYGNASLRIVFRKNSSGATA